MRAQILDQASEIVKFVQPNKNPNVIIPYIIQIKPYVLLKLFLFLFLFLIYAEAISRLHFMIPYHHPRPQNRPMRQITYLIFESDEAEKNKRAREWGEGC